ncbi:acyltransferase domain-containing protein [Rhodospirillum sp. A1_3_36]|uniref:acyltransferase domain-containing protein n=1 Tax=Rhodospirillum sp. A1_3_36 TaxID=3391666 RepID=UPI0039A4266A
MAGPPRILFVFSGMGPQWPGMGRVLWERETVFRQTLEEIDGRLQLLAGFSLIDAMMGPANEDDADKGAEGGAAVAGAAWDCRVAQPAQLALQVGLVRLLASQGVEPDICLGHSAGEIASAYCSGHLSLDDALAVCWARSDLQSARAGNGGLLAVMMDAAEARAFCDRFPKLEVAAFNARRAISLAGLTKDLVEAERELRRTGVKVRRLEGDIGYHSVDMDPLLEPLRARLVGLTPLVPSVPLVSSVTARQITGQDPDVMDGPYWQKNVRLPVHFADALDTALALGGTHFLEIGAKPVLQGAMRDKARERKRDIPILPTLEGEKDAQKAIERVLSWIRRG